MTTPPADDFLTLLKQARAGDAGAQERLFERLGDVGDPDGAAILQLARKVLPSGDRARDFVESIDLVQSALRSGWLDLHDFKGNTEREFFGWLRGILHHKLGRVTRRKRPLTAAELPAQEAGGSPPLDDIMRHEVRQRVRAAVESLPENQREVMELRLEGMKSPEIARILGIKEETVRKRESRAAERLRELLD